MNKTVIEVQVRSFTDERWMRRFLGNNEKVFIITSIKPSAAPSQCSCVTSPKSVLSLMI